MIAERIARLMSVVKADPDLMGLITRMIEVCREYNERVIQSNEYMLNGSASAQSPADFRERMTELDRNRRITHKAVVASVRAVDRLCEQQGTPLVFGGDYEDPLATADFARSLASEYLEDEN